MFGHKLTGVDIMPNARDEELYASWYFKNFIFMNKELIIGDDYSQRVPDIYTRDKSFGVDIVRNEVVNHFIFSSFIKDCRYLKFEADKCQQLLETQYKNHNFTLIVKPSTNQVVSIKSNLEELSAEKYYEALKTNFTRKLDKLRCGNYDGCEKRCLCVLSNLSNRNGAAIGRIVGIYNQIAKDCEKKFDVLFVIFKQHIYAINKTGKVKHYSVKELNKTKQKQQNQETRGKNNG